MDIIYECADGFMKLKDKKYHFVFVQNRKKHDITLDFNPTDFRHATGLHHITDIVIENNPTKLINSILNENLSEINDSKLEQSKKYVEESPYTGSIKERISDMRFLEQCLDGSDFMRIYQVQPFGSQINADYFIEAYCKEIKANVYVFIRKRAESDNYVIVSFFRKKVIFNGISTYWLLKEKISNGCITETYRSKSYR